METKPTLRTLILLPGLLCDATAWSQQCESLAPIASCHVPSYGNINHIEAMADHVLASAPAKRFALAGHSMGGRVALEIVRKAPQRVERLCLLDTGFEPISSALKEEERKSRYALLSEAKANGMRAMGRRWAHGMVHHDHLNSSLFENILDMIERASISTFEAQIQALLHRPDASDLLPSIKLPTLLLCGSADTWSPPSRHEVMRAAIPGARLTLIPNSGHMTTMEQAESVSAELATWLDGSTEAIA